MSIRDRCDDAAVLWEQKRYEGALLSLLVGIAATSRKRYPQETGLGDRVAFTKFLKEEILVLTQGGAENISIHLPQANPKYYPTKTVPLEDIFYTYIRCTMAHEGGLPKYIQFTGGPSSGFQIDTNNDTLKMSRSFIEHLNRVIIYAPENFDEFDEVSVMPDDVVSWVLFGKRRENYDGYMKMRRQRINEMGSALHDTRQS